MTPFGIFLELSNFQAKMKQDLGFILEMVFSFFRDYTPNY